MGADVRTCTYVGCTKDPRRGNGPTGTDVRMPGLRYRTCDAGTDPQAHGAASPAVPDATHKGRRITIAALAECGIVAG